MLFDKPIAMTEALRFEKLKTVLKLSDSIGSRDIQDFIPAHIRESSMFSARTAYAGILEDYQDKIGRMLQPGTRVTPEGLQGPVPGDSLSFARARAEIQQAIAGIGYQPDPKQRGGLQDLSSDRRVNLVLNTQLSMARGRGVWRQSQDSDVLNVWPADELFRAIMPKGEARDWQTRWNIARQRLLSTTATIADTPNGPFVALKNDPIWFAISRFGTPYPPFDYGSGMRVRNVGRRRAIALGVMTETDTVTPVKDPLTQAHSVAIDRTKPQIAAALQSAFGDRASLQGDRLFILPDPAETLNELLYRSRQGDQATGAFAFVTPEQQPLLTPLMGRPVKPGATFDINADHITHIINTHGGNTEKQRNQVPITADDILALPRLIASAIPRHPTPGELRNAGPLDLIFDGADGYKIGATYAVRAARFLVRTLYRRFGQ